MDDQVCGATAPIRGPITPTGHQASASYQRCGAPIRFRSACCGHNQGPHTKSPAGVEFCIICLDEEPDGDGVHDYDPGGPEHIRIVEGAPCAECHHENHEDDMCTPCLILVCDGDDKPENLAHDQPPTWEAYDAGHPAIPEEVTA